MSKTDSGASNQVIDSLVQSASTVQKKQSRFASVKQTLFAWVTGKTVADDAPKPEAPKKTSRKFFGKK